jgi:hypothetical protein
MPSGDTTSPNVERTAREIKAVEKLAPIHEAQLLTRLKLTGHRLGVLLNFNTRLIKDGTKRIVLYTSKSDASCPS